MIYKAVITTHVLVIYLSWWSNIKNYNRLFIKLLYTHFREVPSSQAVCPSSELKCVLRRPVG